MSKKILIVDDEEQDRKAIGRVLQKGGYRDIADVDTAQKAREIVGSLKPDLILIDVVLRDTDGFSLCKQLKTMEGMTAKIIMVTGRLEKVDVEKARVSQADEIIEKVPGFGNVVPTIHSFLQ